MSTNDPLPEPAMQKYSLVKVPPARATSSGLPGCGVPARWRVAETVYPSTVVLRFCISNLVMCSV
jgi:hypothetical protein